jgi:hypothetical protein
MGKYSALLEDSAAAPVPGKYAALLDEPSAPAPEQPSLLRRIGSTALGVALPPLAWAGQQIDRVSGAPLRKGISDAMDVAQRDPERNVLLDLPAGLTAFAKGAAQQFGRDPSLAPTSKALAVRGGVSDQGSSADISASPVPGVAGFGASFPMGGSKGPSPADLAGVAGDLATPLPGLGELKMIGSAARPMARMVGAGAEGLAKGADVLTGTQAATKAIGAVKTIGKATEGAFEGAKKGFGSAFNAKQADDFGESVKTAMANGIDPKLLPEAVEFGHNSIMTRTARVEAEGITGQPLLEKFHAGLDQVRDAVRSDIERLGGGAPLSKPEAGDILRDGFNSGVDRAFDAVNTTHKDIIAAAPDLRLAPARIEKIAPKLEELEKWAQAKAANGLTNTAKGQGQQILNAIQAFRSKGESYAGAYEALQEIGDVAFKSKNTLTDIPPDISRFRKLYGDISDAMIGTVEDHFGIDKAVALKESNAAMHKIYGDKSLLGKIGQEATSPEQLFSSIIEHGDTKRIAALKPYLDPEQLSALKGAFLNSLVKQDAEGNFPFKSLYNALRQKNTVASALFEPGELDNLQSLIKLGDKFGSAVMSTSGTGASNAIRESVKEIGNSIADNAISGSLKEKARAIGFNVDEPLRSAAQGSPRPPTMGLSPSSKAIGELNALIPRKRTLRAIGTQIGPRIGTQDQEQQ